MDDLQCNKGGISKANIRWRAALPVDKAAIVDITDGLRLRLGRSGLLDTGVTDPIRHRHVAVSADLQPSVRSADDMQDRARWRCFHDPRLETCIRSQISIVSDADRITLRRCHATKEGKWL